MKYVIAQAFGTQYIFKNNESYDIRLKTDIKPNSYLLLHKILFFKKTGSIQVGQPFLKNMPILVKVIKTVKKRKLTILKTKPKKHYTRTKGHTEFFTRVQIIN